MPTDSAQAFAVFGALAWFCSIAFAVLKGRDLVAKAALEAVGSIEGRGIVLTITNEKHTRVEDKLDALAKSVDALAVRLEGRIDAMTVKLESGLSRLDADARDLDIRMARVEENHASHREQR